MKKILLSAAGLLLVGAGCTSTVATDLNTSTNTAVETNTDAAVNTPVVDVNVGTDANTQPTEPNKVSFDVKGNSFSFDPTTIRVKKGDVVTINFTNTEGFHDWVIDEFNARTKQIKAGESESITFVADKIGSFEYYCSVGAHRAMGMVGTLIVE